MQNSRYYGDPNSICAACDCPNAYFATSQIVLYETTNIIDIYIKDKNSCSGWNGGLAIEGIQDATSPSPNAVTVAGRNNTVWTATNDAYRFTPAGASQYSLTWYSPPNTVIGTANTITVCPTTTTSYTATVVNVACSGNDTLSASTTVSVGSGQITATVTPTSCPGNTGSATATLSSGATPFTYSWNPTGQITQTATGLSAGIYTVTVTDTTGCSATDTVVVDCTTGVIQQSYQNEFTIYPNPTSGMINVKWIMEIHQPSTINHQPLTIEIYNVMGECINRQIIKSPNQQIDLSAAPSGVYFLQLKTSEGMAVKQLIVNK